MGHYTSECDRAHADGAEERIANMNVNSDEDDYDNDANHLVQLVNIEMMAVTQGVNLLQSRRTLNPDYYYLDTCATYSSSINADHLSGIHTASQGFQGHCNAGTLYINKVRKFGKLDMWLNPAGIANLISFHQLEKLYNISYSTMGTTKCFIVHTPDGDVTFKHDKLSLPYVNAKDMAMTAGGVPHQHR